MFYLKVLSYDLKLNTTELTNCCTILIVSDAFIKCTHNKIFLPLGKISYYISSIQFPCLLCGGINSAYNSVALKHLDLLHSFSESLI